MIAYVTPEMVRERILELEQDLEFLLPYEKEEHDNLLEIVEFLETHQRTLIPYTGFVEFAREVARDVYMVGDHWPFDHINWEDAAEALKQDYQTVVFNDEEHYYRR